MMEPGHQDIIGCLLDGRYEVEARLNSGAYGEVFMAQDVINGMRVAVKRLFKPGSIPESGQPALAVDERSEEVLCHEILGSHPNIVNLIRHFETESHVYLVLEFCAHGDLFEAIQVEKGPLKTEHVRAFMLQLVDAVEYMHSMGFFHRDIKPENIFLTETGDAKLGDFGLVTRDEWSYEVAVGSERYMAPEQYDPTETGYSPAQADIWAVGICLLNVLFASNPFKTPSETDSLFADYLRDPQSLFDLFPKMTIDTFNVLTYALAINPAKRSLAGMRDALLHVISFTTDDETYDEFCTETRDVVPVSAHREPLRTPSIKSPAEIPGGAFPWAKVLHATPPPKRQLSSIVDVSDGMSDSASFVHPDVVLASSPGAESSVFRRVDSGLGSSLVSVELRPSRVVADEDVTIRAQPVPVPTTSTKPGTVSSSLMSLNLGKSGGSVSKSWYDIWDEEEEEAAELERQSASMEASVPLSATSHLDDDAHYGAITIRKPKATGSSAEPWRATMHVPPSRNRGVTPAWSIFESGDGRDSYLHVDQPPRRASPKLRHSKSRPDIMDRWSALGRRRRAFNVIRNAPAPTGSAAARGSPWDSFRREAAKGKAQPDHDDNNNNNNNNNDLSDDNGDLEWVGGWHDLQLEG